MKKNKVKITFNQLLTNYQAKYGKEHDNIFFEIVCSMSKIIRSKEEFIGLRERAVDFNIKKYEKKLHDYYVKQMPLAHVVGTTTFLDLKFRISKKVLAPRDVTAQMVKDFIEVHKKDTFHEVLDLCSGSGCIGVSIKKYLPQCNVTCIDKYWACLFDAAHNGTLNDTAITVDVKDAIEYLNSKSYIDILISNPPYINPKNFKNHKMFKYEWKKALIAKEDGLYFFRRYFDYLSTHPFNEAWLEFGYDQKEALPNLLKASYKNLSYEIPFDKQYIIIKPKQ